MEERTTVQFMLLTTKTKSLWGTDLLSFGRNRACLFIPLKLGILRMRTRERLHFVIT